MSNFSSFSYSGTTTTELYTLSLHDALPISFVRLAEQLGSFAGQLTESGVTEIRLEYEGTVAEMNTDRKSTRLNSSHVEISYAVFCLKKKKMACQRLPLLPLTPVIRRRPSPT